MRAISLTQPWASLVAAGAKRVETRSWSTGYRGPLAIHAAKGFPPEAVLLCYEDPFRVRLPLSAVSNPRTLPLGAVIATCRLTAVLPIVGSKLPTGVRCVGLDEEGIVREWTPSELAGVKMHVGEIQLNEHEAAFGDYTPGRFAWLLDKVRVLPRPIPCRGALGLWHVPPEVLAAIGSLAIGADALVEATTTPEQPALFGAEVSHA